MTKSIYLIVLVIVLTTFCGTFTVLKSVNSTPKILESITPFT